MIEQILTNAAGEIIGGLVMAIVLPIMAILGGPYIQRFYDSAVDFVASKQLRRVDVAGALNQGESFVLEGAHLQLDDLSNPEGIFREPVGLVSILDPNGNVLCRQKVRRGFNKVETKDKRVILSVVIHEIGMGYTFGSKYIDASVEVVHNEYHRPITVV